MHLGTSRHLVSLGELVGHGLFFRSDSAFGLPSSSRALLRCIFARHIAVDVLRRDSDLSQYEVVVASVWYVASKADAKKIQRFVEDGGIFNHLPHGSG